MPEKYMPRKLPRNREYPGYQFFCTLEKQNSTPEACFCFAVLCVVDWLKERLRETDVIPEQIACLPQRQNSSEICPADLKSFTINSGFSAYVVSLPAHGIWSLRLKEPDSNTQQRTAIPGRFFATNIGLRISGGRVELGIRIDVTDPEEAPEIDFAFRPKLVRYLYEAPDLQLSQVTPLPYQKAVPVETEQQLKQLKTLLDSSESTLPVILVTQAFRLPEELSAPLGRPAFPSALCTLPVPEPYYPLDADDIASHNFGHAVTCQVSEKMHQPLAARLKKDYLPGDLLFVDPRRYGGHVRIIGKDEKDAAKQVWQRSHCYSKNRKYSFGDVLFEYDARNLENREPIIIRSSS